MTFFSLILLTLISHGYNATPDGIFEVVAQDEWNPPAYYCWDFAKAEADALTAIGREAYVVYGFKDGGGHYWVAWQGSPADGWEMVEPQTGMPVTAGDGYEAESVFAPFGRRKLVLSYILNNTNT